MITNEQCFALPSSCLNIEIPETRQVYPNSVRRDHGVPNHLMSVLSHAMDVGALTLPVGVRGTREAYGMSNFIANRRMTAVRAVSFSRSLSKSAVSPPMRLFLTPGDPAFLKRV